MRSTPVALPCVRCPGLQAGAPGSATRRRARSTRVEDRTRRSQSVRPPSGCDARIARPGAAGRAMSDAETRGTARSPSGTIGRDETTSYPSDGDAPGPGFPAFRSKPSPAPIRASRRTRRYRSPRIRAREGPQHAPGSGRQLEHRAAELTRALGVEGDVALGRRRGAAEEVIKRDTELALVVGVGISVVGLHRANLLPRSRRRYSRFVLLN